MKRAQPLYCSIIWTYRDCEDTQRHRHPQWIVCRFGDQVCQFWELNMPDRTVRAWAWIICIWRLIRAKCKLLKDGWLFLTRITNYLECSITETRLYKLQNVTRYCMYFSYFDDLTRSPPLCVFHIPQNSSVSSVSVQCWCSHTAINRSWWLWKEQFSFIK